MSFSFGNTTQNTFGATAKPTGFGTPMFGASSTATTAASTGFGFGSSTFGAAAPVANTGFGANATTPAFGTSFGMPAKSAANTTFGGFGGSTTFGAPASTAPNLFGAAATSKPTLFGATSTPSLFSTQTPTTPSLFGAATTTTQAPSLFGATTTTTPSLFGNTATSTPSLFGTSFGATATTAAAPSLFGNTATPATGGFSLFGNTATTTSAPLFGSFGTNTATNTFGNTGTGFNFGGSNSLFGAKPGVQQQQPNQTQQSAADMKTQQTLASFYAINVFGDERDDILKKWNMLQASWGTGKGFYNSAQQPVEYDNCNLFYRFKAISYFVIPQMDNADGLVKLVFNKKESELSAQKATIISGFNGILGNKPNLTVNIVHVKAVSDTESELMITVSEKGVTGTSRKIHATDLAAFLNQPTQKQQLAGAGVTYVGAYMMPSKAQLAEYLKEPPPGIDAQLWKAAQMDNPNPQKYLPTPLSGFSNLKKRMLCEEFETGLHRAFLDKVHKDIVELKKKHAASIAQIAEQKQKFLQLQHRVLKILVKQESTRNLGLALQPQEEVLKARLESMNLQLNMPTQFRGKINELMSTTKVKNVFDGCKSETYVLDPKVQEDVKQFLTMEQNGITHLISIINEDLKDLKVISGGMNEILMRNK